MVECREFRAAKPRKLPESAMEANLSVAAVVTAGWMPSDGHPLAQYCAGGPKALIPIAGKPMIAHVVDALARSRYVEHIVIVALDPQADVEFISPVVYLPGPGGPMENTEVGMNYAFATYPGLDAVLVCSSDVPTITAVIVDSFIERCFETDDEVYYSLVEQGVMEARFPEAKRTYIPLRDGRFAGGDVGLVRAGTSFSQQEMWERLSRSRKSVLRQVRLFGFRTLLRFVTHRLSIADAERRARRALGIRGRGVPCPYAEVGMDVDKPAQLEIVRNDLEARADPGAA
jgi:GTP:adenosylcobinamide-phosphate guanylyltransferase